MSSSHDEDFTIRLHRASTGVWRATVPGRPGEVVDGPTRHAVIIRAQSLALYDEFYATLERVLRDRERRYGKFVVLDVHSYNHCRDGAGCAADPAQNPEVNVGTGSVDRARWGPLVDRFMCDLAEHGLDVRENIKFQGGHMSRWIHQTFPTTGVALALEFKKTFMDEWTGVVDDATSRCSTSAPARTRRSVRTRPSPSGTSNAPRPPWPPSRVRSRRLT